MKRGETLTSAQVIVETQILLYMWYYRQECDLSISPNIFLYKTLVCGYFFIPKCSFLLVRTWKLSKPGGWKRSGFGDYIKDYLVSTVYQVPTQEGILGLQMVAVLKRARPSRKQINAWAEL